MPDYDAILIPGGGVRAGGTLPAWVAARFDLALQLRGDSFLMPLSLGTPHRPPPLDERGFPIAEAAAGARYLMQRGVERARILIESCSYDTIGNAYFSRVVHVIPRGFSRLLVITSEFHMPRTEAVFRWIYSLPGGADSCSVDFRSTPNIGIEEAALSIRLEKECASLAAARALQATITSLAALHGWLFSEHGAYAASTGARIIGSTDAATY
jgi:hypothetical protein